MNLKKVCPRGTENPVFLLTNTTDDQQLSDDKDWAPEDLTIWITYGRSPGSGHDIAARVPITVFIVVNASGVPQPIVADPGQRTVTLKPGHTAVVATTFNRWAGAFYANTIDAEYRGRSYSLDNPLQTRQFCICDDLEDAPETTGPPVTAPPTTGPVPTTAPPVTSPPTTAPPVTSPPTTAPPVTSPPTTAPPVTSPPTTQPPATTSTVPRTTTTGGGGS